MGTEYCEVCGCCGGGVLLVGECDTVPVCTSCLTRFRKIEEAAKWWAELLNAYVWVDWFLSASGAGAVNRIVVSNRYWQNMADASVTLEECYLKARADLARLLGEGE